MPELVQEIAESILEIGQQAPILVRPDEGRFVLVEGLHRFEACKGSWRKNYHQVLVSAEIVHQKTLLSDSAEAELDKMARSSEPRRVFLGWKPGNGVEVTETSMSLDLLTQYIDHALTFSGGLKADFERQASALSAARRAACQKARLAFAGLLLADRSS
jgi:hypothetical protein